MQVRERRNRREDCSGGRGQPGVTTLGQHAPYISSGTKNQETRKAFRELKSSRFRPNILNIPHMSTASGQVAANFNKRMFPRKCHYV